MNRTNIRQALEEIEAAIRAYRNGQIMLTDMYIVLVRQIGRLGRESVKERAGLPPQK